MIEILDTGLQATIQDGGRPGLGHLGVPAAGAVDPISLRLGNLLVGNDSEAAGLEFLLGKFAVRFLRPATFSLTGAPLAAELDGQALSLGAEVVAGPDSVLRAGRPAHGLRTYLCIAGGIDVQPVLGSRSQDTLSGLGPAPLRAGKVLPVGRSPARRVAPVDMTAPLTVSTDPEITVGIRLGPRDDCFPTGAVDVLQRERWLISHQTDRVAARLNGPRLPPENGGQLPTEGLAAGSIQVPPSGQLIVHLANHPPTGGYPVLAVVDETDAIRIGQSRPGTGLRFRILPSIDYS